MPNPCPHCELISRHRRNCPALKKPAESPFVLVDWAKVEQFFKDLERLLGENLLRDAPPVARGRLAADPVVSTDCNDN